MATEKAPLLSPHPIMIVDPVVEESSASRSLFVNDAAEMEAGKGEDGPATQKWEVVIVYPNIPPNTFTSPEENVKQQKRDALVGQLRNVGLFVSQRESSDTKQTFLLVGASQAKFEEYAEMFGLDITLKVSVTHVCPSSLSVFAKYYDSILFLLHLSVSGIILHLSCLEINFKN
jgi:hypothetical protein